MQFINNLQPDNLESKLYTLSTNYEKIDDCNINVEQSSFENLYDSLISDNLRSSTTHVLFEFYTNGYKDEFLLILSLISIILGILVIISKNPIISVLFLIGLFMSISFYLMFLGFNFLGISYLLVYIGAVSILFLFILMLINVRVSELLSDTYNSIVLSILITLYFSTTLNQTIPYNISGTNNIYDSYFTESKYENLLHMDIFNLGKNSNNDVSYVSYES